MLPDNYQLYLKWLQDLPRHLRQDPVTLQVYDSFIQNQIKQGIVQPAEDLEFKVVVKVLYLPHHAVIWQDKGTTMLWVIYNGSAELMDLPSTIVCIPDQCLTSRSWMYYWDFVHRFALTADIEKAFLMVAIYSGERLRCSAVYMDWWCHQGTIGFEVQSSSGWCFFKPLLARCHNKTPLEEVFLVTWYH